MSALANTQVALLPCPFCGSTDSRRLELWIALEDGEVLVDGVECNTCDAQARESMWNRRPADTDNPKATA